MIDKSIKVNLLLPRSLWKSLAVTAARSGVSRAEFVRRSLTTVCAGNVAKGYPAPPAPQQVAPPIVTAPEPEPEWYDPDPDYDPDFDYHTQIIQGVSHEKSVDEVKVYCRQLRRPDWEPRAEVVRAAAAEWAAKQSAGVVPSADRFTPATHDNIPADWVNEYGLTLAQQNALGREDDLEYGPPAARPGIAH